METISTSAREVLSLTGHLVERLGARILGSASCAEAADEIAAELVKTCNNVHKERFVAHPGAFWHSGELLSVAYSAGLALLAAGGPWIYLSTLFFLIDLLLLLNFIFYTHPFDPFFRKVEGTNVIGCIEPAGAATQQILVVGHHDTAYAWRFLDHFQNLFAFRVLGAILSLFVGLISSLLWSFHRLAYRADPVYSVVLLIAVLAGLIFIVPYFFYFHKEGSPGAGDNLVACAIGIKIAELLHGDRMSRPLKRTRVIILSTDGEEPGLLGAEAFVRTHRQELLGIKTYVLNFDSIYRARDLALVTADRNGTIRLSAPLVEDCRKIAMDLGRSIKVGPIPTGGGATDAARFAEIGVEATSIIGISTALIRNGLVFHTANDTVEHIEAEAVETCLSIVYRYIRKKDHAS
jgi:aminopeptidase YwaD